VSRRLLVLVLIAAAVFAAQVSPARAAASGPLSVHVEGTLGAPSFEQPTLTAWPFRASQTLRGLIDVANEIDGTVVAFDEGDPDRPIVTGSVYGTLLPPGAATIACVATQFGARGEPLGGSCAVAGAIVGRGELRISAFELAPGGSLSWDIAFPSVFCRRC
jgi:hypothetical protein